MLSRVHWVRPELVAEVKYLAWTADNLLRQVVYEGLREDKPPAEVAPCATALKTPARPPGDRIFFPLRNRRRVKFHQ